MPRLQLVEFDAVLSPQQCERVIHMFGNLVMPSLVGRPCARRRSSARTSSSVKIAPGGLPETIRSDLEARIVAHCALPSSHQEPWELIRYRQGERYAVHSDYSASTRRQFSVLLYLQAPIAGGETSFPAAGLSIKPVQGKLVIWNNTTDGQLEPQSQHASQPVLQGEKWSLLTWLREQPYAV